MIHRIVPILYFNFLLYQIFLCNNGIVENVLIVICANIIQSFFHTTNCITLFFQRVVTLHVSVEQR